MSYGELLAYFATAILSPLFVKLVEWLRARARVNTDLYGLVLQDRHQAALEARDEIRQLKETLAELEDELIKLERRNYVLELDRKMYNQRAVRSGDAPDAESED